MADSFIEDAFNAVCPEAKEAKGAFVCLMERTSFYGGPEEGGWWGHDSVVVRYQWYDTEEAAEAARVRVEQLAKDLSAESRKQFGEQCLREMEWLEARGLDADYLPEPDGDSEFYVTVSDTVPESRYASRHYE